MKIKSVQLKIALWAGFALLITTAIIITYSALSMREIAINTAEHDTINAARTNAFAVKFQLEKALDAAKSVAQTLSAVKDEKILLDIGREEANGILQTTLQRNPEFAGVYTVWEPDAFDGMDMGYIDTDGHDKTGRFIPYWSRNPQGEIRLSPTIGYDAKSEKNFYELCKKTKQECLVNPHMYPIQGNNELVISLVAPIIANERFYGITGIDLRLNKLQEIADKLDIFDKTGTLVILSNDGTICGVTGHPERVGKNMIAIRAARGEDQAKTSKTLAAIQNAKETIEFAGEKLRVFTPLTVGQTATPWSVKLEVPKEIITAKASSAMWKQILLGVICLLLALGLLYFFAKKIADPIKQVTTVLVGIAKGEIDHTIEVNSDDEIGLLQSSSKELITYIQEIAEASQRIAQNDLTVQVKPKSEKDVLGNSFKIMIENLSGMIRQLADNARELVSAATQISSTAEQLSQGVNEQAQQINQVSSGVEEVTATIVESSRNAGEATDASRNASTTASTGGQIVSDTIQGMQRIADVVRDSAESIAKLANSADQIGEIIGVIDDIADQTNLLALNAAIEAARAGEQGRGFAVVADEVRKLAERTSKATSEITDMIKGIQHETEDAVNSMEAGIQEVDKGRELADKAGNSLNEIVAMNQRVVDMIEQIASAAEQQSTAAEEISRSIEQISNVIDETAKGAEQSAAAAEELNRQAEGLQQMVSRFKIHS